MSLLLVSHNAFAADEAGRTERTITGVVYGRSTSPSGRGVESVWIATGSGIYEFVYAKPLRAKFAHPSCEDLGALWRAHIVFDQIAGRRLVHATCEGKSDAVVRSAAAKLRRFLALLLERNYVDAYALFDVEWRKAHTYDVFADYIGKIRIDDPRYHPPFLWCLRVVGRASSTAVRFAITVDCYPAFGERPVESIRFDLRRRRSTQDWQLTGVDAN